MKTMLQKILDDYTIEYGDGRDFEPEDDLWYDDGDNEMEFGEYLENLNSYSVHDLAEMLQGGHFVFTAEPVTIVLKKKPEKKPAKKRKMKLSIIDYNTGQVPYTIKEALAVAELSYREIRKELAASSDYWVLFRTQWSGWDFSIRAEKVS